MSVEFGQSGDVGQIKGAFFANQSLARQLELNELLNMADHTQTMARLYPDAGAVVLPVGGGVAVFTGRTSPVNRTIGLGMSQPVFDTEFTRIEEFYNPRGLFAQVDLCPLADPSLRGLLGQRGYRVYRFWNVHVRRLVPNEEVPASDIRVAPLELAEADLWSKTAGQAFSGHEELPPPELHIKLANIAINRPDVRCLVAWIGDEPVGVAGLAIRNRLATLFSAATRLPFRKRGVQRALIEARLATAAAAGCDMAMVITLPGNNSQRNVERAGFRIAYTKITMLQS
jgi:GNAT superfamily N-acetyltransferase